MNTPLCVNHLTKIYGHVKAVDDVSFSINEGEVFGLLGPNGAGKTTSISCITTLEEPTSGEVLIFGKNNMTDPKRAKFQMGSVPQELIHHSYFTVEEILSFHASYYGIRKARQWILELLEKLGLLEHRKKLVNQLSGGMKRRLLIAKALIHKPRLLLLDEPTAGVDVELRRNLWELVRELRNEGVSILLTTHYLEEAEALCDRLGIIKGGKLIKQTDKSDLLQSMGVRTVTFHLTEAMDQLNHPYLHEQTEHKITLKSPQHMSISNLLVDLNLKHSAFSDISVIEASLEDVFTKLMKEN